MHPTSQDHWESHHMCNRLNCHYSSPVMRVYSCPNIVRFRCMVLIFLDNSAAHKPFLRCVMKMIYVGYVCDIMSLHHFMCFIYIYYITLYKYLKIQSHIRIDLMFGHKFPCHCIPLDYTNELYPPPWDS
jgi:hypothetical protein